MSCIWWHEIGQLYLMLRPVSPLDNEVKKELAQHFKCEPQQKQLHLIDAIGPNRLCDNTV